MVHVIIVCEFFNRASEPHPSNNRIVSCSGKMADNSNNNNSGSNFVHLDISAFTGVFNQAIHEALARQQSSTTPSGTAGTPSGSRHANPCTNSPSTTNSSDENKRLVCPKLLCLHYRFTYFVEFPLPYHQVFLKKRKSKPQPAASKAKYQEWDRDIMCIPNEQYAPEIKIPRGRVQAKLASYGLVGKVRLNTHMCEEEIFAEIKSVFFDSDGR